MPIKYKNGKEAKADDRVVGRDHAHRPCAGVVVKGTHGQDELVFKNDSHGAVQPSLSLTNFLLEADKDWKPDTNPPLTTAQ